MAEKESESRLTAHIPHRKNAAEWVMYAMVLPVLWVMRLRRRWLK